MRMWGKAVASSIEPGADERPAHVVWDGVRAADGPTPIIRAERAGDAVEVRRVA